MTLYGIETTHNGLCVYIDNATGNTSIQDCDAVMKQINYSTDTDKLHIEVSSKGLYPPLFTKEHYEGAIDQCVRIKANNKTFKGTLVSVSDDMLTLEKGEHTFNIAITSIQSARTLPAQRGE